MSSSPEGSSSPHRRCGPRPRAPEELRETVLVCRVTAAEKAQIVARAEAAGVTIGRYLRQSALGGAPAAKTLVPEDRVALVKLGTNLNQIARHLNAGALGAPADTARLQAELSTVLSALKQRLGVSS